jgi:hypothetical protein
MGDYGFVNEIIKFIWKYTYLDIFLTYILQEKKSSIQQKLTHVETFENNVQILVIQKSIIIFWLKLL